MQSFKDFFVKTVGISFLKKDYYATSLLINPKLKLVVFFEEFCKYGCHIILKKSVLFVLFSSIPP